MTTFIIGQDTLELPSLESMTENVISYFHRATPEQLRAGLSWYVTARELCQTVADKYGYPMEVIAAFIAVTSPGSNWDTQIKYLDYCVGAFSLGEVPKFQTYGQNIDKAKRLFADESPDTVVKGSKVTRFWKNLCGDESIGTIDRHALRVAVDNYVDVRLGGQVLNNKERYAQVEGAYKLAAQTLGYSVCQVQAVTWEVRRSQKEETK